MNDLVSPWVTETLTDDGRAEFYQAALAYRVSAADDAKSVRQLGLIVGAAGMVCAIVAVAAAAHVYLKTPVPPPPGYIVVDRQTGVIEAPIAAKDVPRFFPESARRAALRDFIVACEGYVPETWAKIDYHTCMVMLTPAEQKRRAEEIGSKGPRFPATVFGPGGWAMPNGDESVPMKFTLIGELGPAGSPMYHYQVRYERTELLSGRETRPRYTADVVLAFHPELPISDRDRLLNPYGTQVFSFSTTRD
jgi:type IV secretory pathway component VirB8